MDSLDTATYMDMASGSSPDGPRRELTTEEEYQVVKAVLIGLIVGVWVLVGLAIWIVR